MLWKHQNQKVSHSSTRLTNWPGGLWASKGQLKAKCQEHRPSASAVVDGYVTWHLTEFSVNWVRNETAATSNRAGSSRPVRDQSHNGLSLQHPPKLSALRRVRICSTFKKLRYEQDLTQHEPAASAPKRLHQPFLLQSQNKVVKIWTVCSVTTQSVILLISKSKTSRVPPSFYKPPDGHFKIL